MNLNQTFSFSLACLHYYRDNIEMFLYWVSENLRYILFLKGSRNTLMFKGDLRWVDFELMNEINIQLPCRLSQNCENTRVQQMSIFGRSHIIRCNILSEFHQGFCQACSLPSCQDGLLIKLKLQLRNSSSTLHPRMSISRSFKLAQLQCI